MSAVKNLSDAAPLVSIWCLAYNHEKYIRDCLDGFVMQKTNFKFEAIIHDDASTDNTARIIQEYADKYPDIIKPIFEKENQYSKHDGSLNRIMKEHMRGRYVALCEGDDYWIDSYKLQRQVDFLETNPEYGLVHSDYACLVEAEGKFVHKAAKKKYTINEGDVFLDLFKECSIKTLTICCRAKFCLNMLELPKGAFQGDRALFFEIARQSKIHYDDYETGVYRVLKNSACHFSDWRKWKEYSDSLKVLDYFYLQYTDSKVIHMQVNRKWFVSDLKYYIHTRQYDKISEIAFVPESGKTIDSYRIVWKLRYIKPAMALISYLLNIHKKFGKVI